jgi:hypothetical protein|tara:strand:+ start:9982 stop:10953 length:972 start_codon:yes stop_codon:yes gene_type:complete
MLQFLPYALAAYGGYQGYRQAKDAGASGIGRLLGTATGAYTGYNLGQAGGFAQRAGFQQPQFLNTIPGFKPKNVNPMPQEDIGSVSAMDEIKKLQDQDKQRSVIDLLLRKKDPTQGYDPLKISALAAGIPLALGAFNQNPVDIYQPTYNLAYGDFASKRPGYKYIDPTTGQEKEYEKVYIPEADPANRGDFRSGPYAMTKTRLRTGGLAEIKKFNEGGINYLPSKVSHDENDATNYVRAMGYVEDGSGNGDKDEDTMLAQLADGEFVTRADGVLGAGIIAGANPNSMKDMREKGAAYFYEQQKRYKRVFDLLKDKYGDSTKKN